jgi:hypothetical protein
VLLSAGITLCTYTGIMQEITEHRGQANTTALYSGCVSADTIILSEDFAWFYLFASGKCQANTLHFSMS